MKNITDDCISRQATIDEIEYELEMINLALDSITLDFNARERLRQRKGEAREILNSIQQLPPAQPERTWYPVTEPPNHHNDVIVRGIEAIGNVTVHKIMQWDVDTWRPADYAPSIMWKEWSEI